MIDILECEEDKSANFRDDLDKTIWENTNANPQSLHTCLMELFIPLTSDFPIMGDGTHAAWDQTGWTDLSALGSKGGYSTRFKALYSSTGVYFLADCEDRKLSCTFTEDFADLFKEDVLELFLQPDATRPVYLEYEISPLGMELPILVSNHQGDFYGWLPWHYTGARQVRRQTVVRGGRKMPGAECTGWNAEFFIPFTLFHGLGNLPVRTGTRWRANVYRIDYDETSTQWAWAPVSDGNFHAFSEFGEWIFG